MKKLVTLAAGLALAAGISTTAQAQTVACSAAGTGTQNCSVNTAVKVTVPTIIKLDVTDSLTTAAAPTSADFDSAYQIVATTVAINMKSNTTSTLSVKAGSANWSGPYNKAAGDLSWTADAGTTYTPMTTSAATVGTGVAGNNPFTVGYKIAWSYANDVPGTYTLPVVFTATAP